jgi:periplasmic copper chaperone A
MNLPLPLRCSRAARPVRRCFHASCRLLLVLAGTLAFGATSEAADNGLTVHDAWMRTIMPSRPAAGYFTLSNSTDKAEKLVSAASPDCGMLMLHRSLHENGQERMVMVKSIPVPAHGAVKFAPGGYHLMCMSPSKNLKPGHSVPVTLHFADGATVTARFPVRGATGH